MLLNMVTFGIIFIIWLFPYLFFPFNEAYVSSLTLPGYLPSMLAINLIWFIIYFLVAISIFIIGKNDIYNNNYLFSLLTTYLFNLVFALFLFIFNNLVGTLVIITITIFLALHFQRETKKLNWLAAYYLIPFLLGLGFNFVALIHIIIIN